MAGFFNRLYYGNPRRPDLKKEEVEVGGVKLFFTVFQIRFWQMILLNLLYSIFWIPVLFIVQGYLLMLAETEGIITLEFFLILTPALMITGPATAGVTYVVRNWARDEHSFLWSDFKDAFKENWKQSLFFMFLNGMALMIFYVGFIFYGSRANVSLLDMILQYLIVAMAVIYGMMNMFIFPMMITYRLKVLQILKNAFIMTMIKLPLALLIFVAAAIVFFMSIYYLASLPLFILGFTLPMLIAISFVNSMFAKYMNNPSEDQDDMPRDNA